MEQLAGRVAVVTGGGDGIGRALSLTLAAEGMDLVIADIRLERASAVAEEARTLGRRALPVAVDVGDRASVEALADAAYAEFGAVHVLCNNAGVVGVSPLTAVEDANWRWLIQVNLWGVVYGLQTFLPRMLDAGQEGHVVNTASSAGLYPGGSGRQGAYVASKYAVVGMTEALAAELEGSPIGATVLCPTATRTDIFHNAFVGRPDTYGGPRPSRGTLADFEARGDVLPEMMDPMLLARRVVRAIRERRRYVVGDTSEVRANVRDRLQRILDDCDWNEE